jgi:SAM-dependent methyltransferase
MIFLDPSAESQQNEQIGDFRQYVRKTVSKDSLLLEVGPSYSPVFSRAGGYNVRTLDHLDAAELRKKYAELNVDISKIETVDYIWHGEPIHEAVLGQKFDYVLASHVIEHAPSFVHFLREIQLALRPDGKIILMVPDKRYCFDFLHPVTDTAKVLAEYSRGSRRHSFEAFYREHSHARAKYLQDTFDLTWGQGDIEAIRFDNNDPVHFYQEALSRSGSIEYCDTHEYYFTPSSFLLIMLELQFMGILDLEVETLTFSRGCEFMAVLTSGRGNNHGIDWYRDMRRELSVNVLREQKNVWDKISSLQQPINLGFLKNIDQ